MRRESRLGAATRTVYLFFLLIPLAYRLINSTFLNYSPTIREIQTQGHFVKGQCLLEKRMLILFFIPIFPFSSIQVYFPRGQLKTGYFQYK